MKAVALDRAEGGFVSQSTKILQRGEVDHVVVDRGLKRGKK